MKPILTILIFFLIHTASAQMPVLNHEEAVREAVTAEIDAVFRSDDFLRKKNKNFPSIHGSMTVDIGVIRNGKVSTFFKAESDITDIDFINFMSDYILKHKFDFKLPKQQRYKIRYTITF